ncbi:Cp7Fb [Drosophila busckii]|uniref:Cp7Fb n=1 Tax=Drosophila busckii TaxID=30019 RepID=A0A0M4EZ17_DROBS|nr:Cp7Fb [Drosophila busckii]
MLMLQPITMALILGLGLVASAPAPVPGVQVVYTGEEGCACPKQLGYQLNVPNPSKPKKYVGGDYGYRVEKPVATKAKITYSFDLTVEQPRTPAPPKYNPAKLYAKVDRITANKGDCVAKQTGSCSCSSCAAGKERYVPSSESSPNAIRRRRDLSDASPGALIRKRIMRQQQMQERPPRFIKQYHKDLEAQQQQKLRMFGLLPAQQSPQPKAKRKTKKATSARWLGGHRLAKRDIKAQIPAPFMSPYNEYKFVDDMQLRRLLSTTSVPDPLEQSSTPLQFAGDLEAGNKRSYAQTPVLGMASGYPVEHVADTQLDSIISGIVYQHPDYIDDNAHYSAGSLVDPEPQQKKQTTDFLKKLIDGRLGGWGFDTSTEPESALRADYLTAPAKTYGYNSQNQNGYSVDTYNMPPITDFLRACADGSYSYGY